MTLNQILLPEFEHEMANTRKVLERIPADQLDWKIHDRSNSIGWVSMHLAEIPHWTEMTLRQDSLDIAPHGAEPYRTPPVTSKQDILDRFDRNIATAREAIGSTTDEEYARPWSLLMTGQVLFTLPKIAVLRSFVLSHMVHHRAILCVYLRMHNIPVPAIYGPSADDQGM